MRICVLPPLLLNATLAGCAGQLLVAPHFVRTQPEVDGVLATAGVPRAGVRISACQGLPESGEALTPQRCDGMAVA